MTTLQQRLKQLQGDQTLRQFSKLTGIGDSTLHNYLHGRDVKATMLVKICRGCGVSADWLLGISDDKKVNPVAMINKFKGEVYSSMTNLADQVERLIDERV